MTRCTRLAAGLLAAVAMSVTACANDPVADTTHPSTTEPGADAEISIEINAAAQGYESTQEFVETNRVFDDIVATLNDQLVLPTPIVVNVGGDPEGPYYDPSTGAIEYPYEFMDLAYSLILRAGIDDDPVGTAVGALRFVFIHELGHALVDQLDVPVLGKEEDAVDGLAAIVLTNLLEDGAIDAISGAQLFYAFFEAAGEDQFGDLAIFADEHSLDLQRFYSILCLVAGSDQEAYDAIDSAELVPEERLVQCPAENEQATESWGTVLEPYLAS